MLYIWKKLYILFRTLRYLSNWKVIANWLIELLIQLIFLAVNDNLIQLFFVIIYSFLILLHVIGETVTLILERL